MRQRFATANGCATLVTGLFHDMFTGRSDTSVVASIIERALRLPRPIGEKMLTDMQRYDVTRLSHSLASLRVPLMALQSTYSNQKRERRSMTAGQKTPYLDMIRAAVPSARVEIIADTGQFSHLDASARTNTLIDSFLATLPAQQSGS